MLDSRHRPGSPLAISLPLPSALTAGSLDQTALALRAVEGQALTTFLLSLPLKVYIQGYTLRLFL